MYIITEAIQKIEGLLEVGLDKLQGMGPMRIKNKGGEKMLPTYQKPKVKSVVQSAGK